MPIDEDDRVMRRTLVAALSLQGLMANPSEQNTSPLWPQGYAKVAVEAADALLERLDEETAAAAKDQCAIYQQRRLRFEAVFFDLVRHSSTAKLADTLAVIWKRACMDVEPEFFPELRK